jgi:hypothetical protein
MLRACTLYPCDARRVSQGKNTSAQPKPPWQKRMGDCRTLVSGKGFGVALRSSRDPERVEMKDRVTPAGRGVGGGAEGFQDRVQRCKDGFSGAGMIIKTFDNESSVF